MSKINKAIYEIEHLGAAACQNKWINNINPIAKIIVTIFYVAVTISFDKCNLLGIFSMAIYPIVMFFVGDISVKDAFYRLRFVLPFVVVLGAFNPLFDTEKAGFIFGFSVSGGVFSMISLILKGVLTLFATYILIATTSIEKICYSLQSLHFPEILVTQIMLTFRYISVLLIEVKKITQSYALRSPKQKGVNFRAWGSLVGGLLLRTFDRANDIYQSMCLRGYTNKFINTEKAKFTLSDFLFLLICVFGMLLLRFFPIFSIIGNLFKR